MVVIQYAAVFDLWCTLHLAPVEPVAGESHDFIVHAVLDFQQGYYLGLVFGDALHQGLAQSGSQGCNTLYGRRQLAMVACQNHPAGSFHRNPAGGFQGLGCLVDKQGAELHAFQQPVGRTHQGAGDDTCLAEEFAIDADFYLGGTALQPIHLLMIVLAAFLPVFS